jgi:hypothetical protein
VLPDLSILGRTINAMTTFNLEQPAKELTEALSKAPPLSGEMAGGRGVVAREPRAAPAGRGRPENGALAEGTALVVMGLARHGAGN